MNSAEMSERLGFVWQQPGENASDQMLDRWGSHALHDRTGDARSPALERGGYVISIGAASLRPRERWAHRFAGRIKQPAGERCAHDRAFSPAGMAAALGIEPGLNLLEQREWDDPGMRPCMDSTLVNDPADVDRVAQEVKQCPAAERPTPAGPP